MIKTIHKNTYICSKIPVTVIILTKNEERNIEYCLSSLNNFNQVLILDSYSTDRTIQIAKNFDVVIYKRIFKNYGDQRNYALNKLPFINKWILFIDADEMVTPELESEIRNKVLLKNNINGYYINRKIFFNNKYLKHSNAFPNWNIRLFKKDAGVVYKDKINEHPIFDMPKIGFVKNGYLLHKNRNENIHFLNKHQRYAKLEAERLKEQRINKQTAFLQLFSLDPITRKQSLREYIFCYIPLKHVCYFIYLYIFKLGILDGYSGLIYCIHKAKFIKLIDYYSNKL